jgi:hypothetical protein
MAECDIGKSEAGECPFSSSQCRSDPRHFSDPLATPQGLATVGVSGGSNDESNLFVKLKKEHISSQGRMMPRKIQTWSGDGMDRECKCRRRVRSGWAPEANRDEGTAYVYRDVRMKAGDCVFGMSVAYRQRSSTSSTLTHSVSDYTVDGIDGTMVGNCHRDAFVVLYRDIMPTSSGGKD